MSLNKIVTILAHAFVGWALCASTMGIGMATTSEHNALIIHEIGTPIFLSMESIWMN